MENISQGGTRNKLPELVRRCPVRQQPVLHLRAGDLLLLRAAGYRYQADPWQPVLQH